jgi:MoaA/NifB/PqqE/SkfB family radical SAM enzyme
MNSLENLNTTEISKEELQTSWNKYLENNGQTEAIVMDITNFCPNDCAHCYANITIGKNTKEMSNKTFDNWLTIFSSSQEKPEQIWLCGGEPTENLHLKEYLQKVREIGIQPMLITTGENFANMKYCREIVPNVDEIDVTIRGLHEFHDLMKLPANNKIFESIPEDLSPDKKLEIVLGRTSKITDSDEHFNTTIQGLINITEIAKETSSNTKIGLNVDIQTMTDLVKVVEFLNSKNIPIENIILQIQTFSENNSELANIIPNIWRKPTTEIIEQYFEQAKYLVKSGEYKGKIEIIDQIPQNILDELKSKNIELGSFYNPVATPAISPDGKLRENVLKEI